MYLILALDPGIDDTSIDCTGSGSEATRSNITDTSDIDTTVADRTNLSTDGTENTDRSIDYTGGISRMSPYAL